MKISTEIIDIHGKKHLRYTDEISFSKEVDIGEIKYRIVLEGTDGYLTDIVVTETEYERVKKLVTNLHGIKKTDNKIKDMGSDDNFIRNFLIVGLNLAYLNLFGLTGLAWEFLRYGYLTIIIGLVIVSPIALIPTFYMSRRNGTIDNYFNSISIDSIKLALSHSFWTKNVIGMIVLCLYFWFMMHDLNLTMATLSVLILWRIAFFLSSDVMTEYLLHKQSN